MIDWRDMINPVGDGIKRVANGFGPVAGLLADAGVELAKFGIVSAEQGMTKEAVIQQVQDRYKDLLSKLAGDGV